MVVSTDLSNVGWAELTAVFNQAFGDYDIPLSLPEEQLKSHLKTINFSASDSMGLFDEGKLVGFLFVGRREERAWDGGTAIIPSHRGRGLAHTLVKETIAHLRQMGCTSLLLEVLSTNERAIKLYRAHGFAVRRTLLCYEGTGDALAQRSSSLALIQEDRPFDASNPFEPSWQNATESIRGGSYTHVRIKGAETPIGSMAYNRATGSIAQIILEEPHRSVKNLQDAIISAAYQMQAEEVRMVNIDERDTALQSAFENLGFDLFTTQYEMQRAL